MSGGSMDYLYGRVDDVADDLQLPHQPTAYRAFGEHLKNVAKALQAIEWHWSSDWSEKPALQAIDKVLHDSKALQIEVLKNDAKELINKLQQLVDE